MQTRRKFLQQSALATGSLLASGSVFAGMLTSEEITKLTILHTNDVHSRLEPFPMDGGKNQGLGGVAARAELIKKIRKEETGVSEANDVFKGLEESNVLLL